MSCRVLHIGNEKVNVECKFFSHAYDKNFIRNIHIGVTSDLKTPVGPLCQKKVLTTRRFNVLPSKQRSYNIVLTTFAVLD